MTLGASTRNLKVRVVFVPVGEEVKTAIFTIRDFAV